ncbi:hypothetical protein [Shouchella lehensis]|uniref:DNA-binding protein n=1 Tax=Shouchella lehensis TaxID=300825 RepID=A0A4Y7WDZ7_9BACI|nr:hypothetical protein [Shouchella lehensis]MBG9783577.1 hypothetical protein [Shouchella lehensis]TES45668.1 hypothetical protein E2L03_20000 [Shouchella lehensis]
MKLISLPIFSNADLARRWNVTSKVVHAWSKRHEDFPTPSTYVDNGKTPIYTLQDILDYEEGRKLLERYGE